MADRSPLDDPLEDAELLDVEEPTSVRRGLVYNAGGMVAARLLTLAFGVVLARLLVPEDYGLYAIVNGVVGIGLVFANIGVGAAYIHRRTDLRANGIAAFWINALVATGIAVCLIALAGPLARFYDNPDLARMMPVMGCAFLIKALTAIHEAHLARDLRYLRLQLANVLGTAVLGTVSIVLAVQGLGAWSLVLGLVAGNTVQAAATVALARMPLGWRLEFGHWRGLLRFSRWIFLAGLLTTAVTQLDNLSVGKVLGEEELGYYALAYAYGVLPMVLLGASLSQVMYSAYARVQPDQQRMTELLTRSYGAAAMVAFPLAGAVALVGVPLLVTVLGERWEPAAVPFAILGTVFTACLFAPSVSSLLYSLDRGATVVGLQVVALTLTLTALFITLPQGITAVAIGVSCVMGVMSCIHTFVATRVLHVRIRTILDEIGPMLVLVLIVSTVLGVLIATPDTLLEIVALVIAYGAILAGILAFVMPARWRRYRDELRGIVRPGAA